MYFTQETGFYGMNRICWVFFVVVGWLVFCFNYVISMSCLLDLLLKTMCTRTTDLTDSVNLPNKVIL